MQDINAATYYCKFIVMLMEGKRAKKGRYRWHEGMFRGGQRPRARYTLTKSTNIHKMPTFLQFFLHLRSLGPFAAPQFYSDDGRPQAEIILSRC